MHVTIISAIQTPREGSGENGIFNAEERENIHKRMRTAQYNNSESANDGDTKTFVVDTGKAIDDSENEKCELTDDDVHIDVVSVDSDGDCGVASRTNSLGINNGCSEQRSNVDGSTGLVLLTSERSTWPESQSTNSEENSPLSQSESRRLFPNRGSPQYIHQKEVAWSTGSYDNVSSCSDVFRSNIYNTNLCKPGYTDNYTTYRHRPNIASYWNYLNKTLNNNNAHRFMISNLPADTLPALSSAPAQLAGYAKSRPAWERSEAVEGHGFRCVNGIGMSARFNIPNAVYPTLPLMPYGLDKRPMDLKTGLGFMTTISDTLQTTVVSYDGCTPADGSIVGDGDTPVTVQDHQRTSGLPSRRPPYRHGNQLQTAPTKKYKCDLCSKAFSRSNTLVTHRVSNPITRASAILFLCTIGQKYIRYNRITAMIFN